MLYYCVTDTCIPRTVFSMWIHYPCTARPHPSCIVYIRDLEVLGPEERARALVATGKEPPISEGE